MGKELGKYLPVARYWMRVVTVVYARLCMVQYCRYQYSAHMDIAYGSP